MSKNGRSPDPMEGGAPADLQSAASTSPEPTVAPRRQEPDTAGGRWRCVRSSLRWGAAETKRSRLRKK